jgi:hypothetical protein
MQLKEKIIDLLKSNNNEELLEEIYLILQESEKDIKLSDNQLKRIDLAEEQIKYGKTKSHDDVMKKFFGNE